MSLLVPGTEAPPPAAPSVPSVEVDTDADKADGEAAAMLLTPPGTGGGLTPPGTAGGRLGIPGVARDDASPLTPDEQSRLEQISLGSRTGQVEEDPHVYRPERIAPVKAGQIHSDLPVAYRTNTAKEQQALVFVQNFVRQYRHLYNNRKPLFINPPNECGVPKFCCTTIRPTLLPYKELYTHDSLGSFVSDYLTYEFLETETDTPPTLQSPTSTVWKQRGNSFDLSVVLCSLLEGAGYDTYCVYGYAKREVCMMDRSRREVKLDPIKPTSGDTAAVAKPKKKNKYCLEPKLTLQSTYDQSMLAREASTAADKAAADSVAAATARSEKRKPSKDPLWGLRVHCWVLVLRGKRGVPENFFIEPSLGEAFSVNDDRYLGIEAIWNSKNYWVNMQDCTEGVGEMSYDLGDSASWEYVLPDPLHPVVSNGLPSASQDADATAMLPVDIPPSWVSEIRIEPHDFEIRCPHGKREFVDENARTEVFAEYLRPDGRIKEVTFYEDYELDMKQVTVETYAHRNDKLIKREIKYTSEFDQVDEIFLPGRLSELRHHVYFSPHSSGHDKGRIMYFYNDARVDGLHKREKSKFQLRETFKSRDDFLAKRVVDFVGGTSQAKTRRRSSIVPSHIPKLNVTVDEDLDSSEIEVITEHYNRNPAKNADDDIAEVVFLDEAVLVTYHKHTENITAQRREIEKPEPDPKQTLRPPVHSEGVVTYVTDTKKPQLRNFENNQILDDLLNMEEKSRAAISAALQETAHILGRLELDSTPEKLKLMLSFYDTTRNAESKARREKLEQDAREEAARRAEMERDYLAPFIVRLSQPQTEIPGMQDHVKKMLSRSKEAADWQDDEGWNEDLMTMFDVELNMFLVGSDFDADDVADLKEQRRQQYVKGVADQCMTDFHSRNTAKEKRINSQIEQEKRALSDKQKWYLEHQSTLRPEQEEEYVNYCSELIFRIGILEKRLVEHREDSRKQEYNLENRLHNDSRLEGLM